MTTACYLSLQHHLLQPLSQWQDEVAGAVQSVSLSHDRSRSCETWHAKLICEGSNELKI